MRMIVDDLSPQLTVTRISGAMKTARSTIGMSISYSKLMDSDQLYAYYYYSGAFILIMLMIMVSVEFISAFLFLVFRDILRRSDRKQLFPISGCDNQ